MIALELIIALLLVTDIGCYFFLLNRFKRMEAAVAAINEDLVEIDADLEELYDQHFPEEAEPETPTPIRPIYIEHGEEIFDIDNEENHASNES